MGYFLTNSLIRLSPVSGSCRQLLSPRLTVLFVDDRGIKQSAAINVTIPEKPKKPLTPYFRFMQQMRPSLLKDNPKFSVSDISKKLSNLWETADPKIKTEIEEQYKKDKEVYDLAKVKYTESLTEEQKNIIEQERLEKKEAKSKRKLKKKSKINEKPKRPLSSYVLYTVDRASSRGTVPVIEWQKKVAIEWKALDQSQKEKYVNEAKRLQAQYATDIINWEKKMIELGNVDIVRTEALAPKTKKSKQ